MQRIATRQQLETLREQATSARPADRKRVTVCGGTGCQAAGCREVAQELESRLADGTENVDLVLTGCHGFCEQGPIVVVRPENVFYPRVKKSQVEEIIERENELDYPRDAFVDQIELASYDELLSGVSSQ